MPRVQRYLLIGVAWELWHFTNRWNGTLLESLRSVGTFMVLTIVFSAIAGELCERTGSLLIALTLHQWVDLLAEFASPSMPLVIGASVVLWTALVWTWPPREATRAVTPLA